MDTNLHPCPFCGRSDELSFRQWQPNSLFSERYLYAAACEGCMSIGPDGKTPEEAAEKWNRRVAVPEARPDDSFPLAAKALYERAIYQATYVGGVRCAGCGGYLSAAAWDRAGHDPLRFPHRRGCPVRWIGELLRQAGLAAEAEPETFDALLSEIYWNGPASSDNGED